MRCSALTGGQRSEEVAEEIRVLNRFDEGVLTRVAAEVFDHPIDMDLTREFLADPRHHIVVAIDDETVVGFVSAVHYVHPDKPAELWINEIGLAPTHRRRGLGKALLRRMLDVGREKNCKAAWVLTDRGNAAAMALYVSSGGVDGVDPGSRANGIVGYSFRLSD
jgi:ribosomal protein S18 acetylase RimI-like enzyme